MFGNRVGSTVYIWWTYCQWWDWKALKLMLMLMLMLCRCCVVNLFVWMKKSSRGGWWKSYVRKGQSAEMPCGVQASSRVFQVRLSCQGKLAAVCPGGLRPDDGRLCLTMVVMILSLNQTGRWKKSSCVSEAFCRSCLKIRIDAKWGR